MKKIILVSALFMLLVSASRAQFIDKATVPAAVTTSFSSGYPGVGDDVWQKDGKKFKVTFKTDTVSHILTFDDAGTTVFHQYNVALASVPKDVVSGGSKTYSDLPLQSAEKVETNGKISYILAFKNGDTPIKVQVSDRGTVMKVIDSVE